MTDLNIEALSTFLESTKHFCMIEISNCKSWCMLDEDEIKWYTNELYASEIIGGVTEHNNHYLINLEDGSGGTYTAIFSKHNKLSVDDFYDKYEDCM